MPSPPSVIHGYIRHSAVFCSMALLCCFAVDQVLERLVAKGAPNWHYLRMADAREWALQEFDFSLRIRSFEAMRGMAETIGPAAEAMGLSAPPERDRQEIAAMSAYIDRLRNGSEETRLSDPELGRYVIVGFFGTIVMLSKAARFDSFRHAWESFAAAAGPRGKLRFDVFEACYGGIPSSLDEYCNTVGFDVYSGFDAAAASEFVLGTQPVSTKYCTFDPDVIDRLREHAAETEREQQEARHNRSATRESWKNERMGPGGQSLNVTLGPYTSEEYSAILRGVVPEAMEDKWFLYVENNVLHCHRSWTGIEVYDVVFEESGEHVSVSNARVSEAGRAPDSELDLEYEAALLRYLIDGVLLGRDVPFPMPEAMSDKSGLEQSMYRHGVGGYLRPELADTGAEAALDDDWFEIPSGPDD